MKSYTDIAQSRKLAEILSGDSADMAWYPSFAKDGYSIRMLNDTYPLDIIGDAYDEIPAWSLSALLNVIKPINKNTYTIRGTLDGGAIISFDEATSVMFQEEEIIDAVFEMVVWLKEIGK